MNRKLVTALATPYANGRIDLNGYVKLLNYQIKNGADALLAVGTTAEGQLLNSCEKKLLIRAAKKLTENKKIPIYAGIEEFCTAKAVKEAVRAQEYGADALLIAPPTFCKCTAVGYVKHIESILDAVSVPLILYNVPSRAGYELDLAALTELKNKAAYIKDAGANAVFTKTAAQNYTVFCGNDELLSEQLSYGAKGVISVVSNAAPKLTKRVLSGEKDDIFVKLAKLSMREVNPIAIKYILYKKGLFKSCEMRLPLTKANAETIKAVDGFFEEYGAEIE